MCYGDLELFLMGEQLGSLIPLFQRHHVEFSNLLNMTDKDLEQVKLENLVWCDGWVSLLSQSFS